MQIKATYLWLKNPQPHSSRQAYWHYFYLQAIKLYQNRSTLIGISIILALLFIALFAPFLAPYGPYDINLNARLLPISTTHWCGTDELGRDILSRLIFGTRITLEIITLVTLLSAPLGLILGTTAGFVGGKLDNVIMRITDVFLAFPRLILAMGLVVALGPGLQNAILAIGLISWAPYARLTRSETLSFRHKDYIQAIRLQGGSHFRIITKHLMPLCLPSLIVRVNLDMAGFILTAAGLGFLGLGAQPPLPEWGAMVAGSRDFLLTHWWITTLPGFALFIVSCGFNLLGEGLRDIFDPKQNQSQI